MDTKLTLTETIQKVQTSPSSIFTKDDVIEILGNISIAATSLEQVRDALDSVLNKLSLIDFVDEDRTDFYIDGKEIYLQNVEFNTTEMTDCIVDELQEELMMQEELSEKPSDKDEEFSDDVEPITETKKGCGENCQCKKKKKSKKH